MTLLAQCSLMSTLVTRSKMVFIGGPYAFIAARCFSDIIVALNLKQ